MMNHLMLDLETLGVLPGAAILSIGAVPFNIETGEYSKTPFYEKITLQSCLELGLTIDADTLRWWLKQDKKVIKEAFPHDQSDQSIWTILEILARYIYRNFKEQEEYYIWGYSNRFDMGLLIEAYNKMGIPYPWKYRNERDMRTLVMFAPEIKKNTPFEGVEHHPVDDCIYQIKVAHKIWRFING